MHDFDRFKEILAFYFSRVVNKPLIVPEHAYICVTNKCNLKCKICNIWKDKTPSSNELDYKEYEKLLDGLNEMKVKHVIFSGGEPFLRKDFFEILEYAGSKDFEKIDVVTNATLIDNECAKKIINSKMTALTISLDGFEEEHDRIRGKGVFKKAMESMKKLDKFNNRDNFFVIVNTVITGRNFKNILKFIDFLKKTKCTRVSLQPVLPDNTDMVSRDVKNSDLWLSEDKIEEINDVTNSLITLKKSSKEYDDFIYVNEGTLKLLPSYFLKRECDFECFEGLNRIVVTPYGDIWTCMGTISNVKKESFKNIWYSEKAKKIRKKITKCKIPCLQGCVYLYGYDSLIKNFDKLLSKLKDEQQEDREIIKNELNDTIKFYKDTIQKELKHGFLIKNKEYTRNKLLLTNLKSKLDAL